MRTLDDADHILQLSTELGEATRGAIYGGGFIACEYLNFFAHLNLPMVLAHRGPHFWSHCLLPQAGELIANHLQEHGVELHPNTTLHRLVGEKQLERFVTSSGDHSATILGVGIGIEPDFSWLQAAGIATNRGIITNEFLETNAPDVYAAGDIAEFFDVTVGRQHQIGNWMNAMGHGRTVAKTMSGERTAFDLVTSYATNALGLEMIFIGDTQIQAAEQVHVIGSIQEGGVSQVFERGGQVVGGALIGRNTDRAPITKAIQEKQPFSQLNLL